MYKRLTRSNTERILAGVLGGLAVYFRIDPTIIRLGFVALLIFTAVFPLAILYLIAAVIIPNESEVH